MDLRADLSFPAPPDAVVAMLRRSPITYGCAPNARVGATSRSMSATRATTWSSRASARCPPTGSRRRAQVRRRRLTDPSGGTGGVRRATATGWATPTSRPSRPPALEVDGRTTLARRARRGKPADHRGDRGPPRVPLRRREAGAAHDGIRCSRRVQIEERARRPQWPRRHAVGRGSAPSDVASSASRRGRSPRKLFASRSAAGQPSSLRRDLRDRSRHDRA